MILFGINCFGLYFLSLPFDVSITPLLFCHGKLLLLARLDVVVFLRERCPAAKTLVLIGVIPR
jgi:hypothetical protein